MANKNVSNKTKLDLTFHRGDTDSIDFIADGAFGNWSITFTVKPNRELASARYVYKRNSVAGGSDSQILVKEFGGKTKFTVFLVQEDTYDLQQSELVYDVTVVDPNDSANYYTIFDGEFVLEYDVNSPFDGFETPDRATRFQQLNASDFPSGALFQISEDQLGDKSFIAITVGDLLDQLGLVNSIDPNNAIWRMTGLKSGTLASPPTGMVDNEIWEDTTDSATTPILRINKS